MWKQVALVVGIIWVAGSLLSGAKCSSSWTTHNLLLRPSR